MNARTITRNATPTPTRRPSRQEELESLHELAQEHFDFLARFVERINADSANERRPAGTRIVSPSRLAWEQYLEHLRRKGVSRG